MYVVTQKDNANAGKTHQKKTRFGYLFDKGAEVVKQVSKDKIQSCARQYRKFRF